VLKDPYVFDFLGLTPKHTLSHTVPENLQGKLPTIAQLEQELGREGDLDFPETGEPGL
jgi:hypothetical protein